MRKTIQATTILAELANMGHATNAQVWSKIQAKLPSITLPSVHRTTVRLAQDGEIGGKLTVNGQVVLDSIPTPHSHFVCDACSRVRDLGLEEELIRSIQRQIGEDIVHNSLVVHGTCVKCVDRQVTGKRWQTSNLQIGAIDIAKLPQQNTRHDEGIRPAAQTIMG